MPAVVMFSAHRGTNTNAFSKTDAGSVTITYTGTDARTDDGDARAHTGTVRGTHTCAVVTTDDGRALIEAHASALLVIIVLERQDYGCYRLR